MKWHHTILDEVVDFTNGGAWDQSEYTDEGIRVARVTNFINESIDLSDCKYLSHDSYSRYRKHELHEGDLVVATVGSHPSQPASAVGRPVRVPRSASGCLLNQNAVCIRPKRDNQLLKRYLFFFAKTDTFKHYILANARGAASQARMSIERMRQMPVMLPPIEMQRKIAGVLSAYDDLIENNTRRIAILEEMAQAIYREWFVNFRFPGHDKVKLINSPLGKIPEGWKPQTIGSTLDFHIGGGWGQDAADDEFTNPAFVIRGTDIPDARSLRVVECPLRLDTNSNIRTRKLRPNDLVFEVSGGSKGQPVGRCLFVSERLLKRFDGDVICASFCKVIRANSAILAPEILYHFLLESYTDGTIEQYEVQSTGIKNFKFTVFLESESLAVPPAQVQANFVGHVRPILDAVHALGKKNEILRNTRDLMLPKLISGQLDVEELDIETGEPLVEAEA